ncbi:hypothetical protein B0T25DRAFT_359092 [Lasiosphaeria hispida]|uniref:Uncharacterized protein n=1 Tax=Lasiosphaeria hispida TaxID=260671 RepID=A0AAJ0M8S7_9PEZI|nr:hypothetical protein B0T25DRAFT_359092 [Lasiosphaeria hispida]
MAREKRSSVPVDYDQRPQGLFAPPVIPWEHTARQQTQNPCASPVIPQQNTATQQPHGLDAPAVVPKQNTAHQQPQDLFAPAVIPWEHTARQQPLDPSASAFIPHQNTATQQPHGLDTATVVPQRNTAHQQPHSLFAPSVIPWENRARQQPRDPSASSLVPQQNTVRQQPYGPRNYSPSPVVPSQNTAHQVPHGLFAPAAVPGEDVARRQWQPYGPSNYAPPPGALLRLNTALPPPYGSNHRAWNNTPPVGPRHNTAGLYPRGPRKTVFDLPPPPPRVNRPSSPVESQDQVPGQSSTSPVIKPEDAPVVKQEDAPDNPELSGHHISNNHWMAINQASFECARNVERVLLTNLKYIAVQNAMILNSHRFILKAVLDLMPKGEASVKIDSEGDVKMKTEFGGGDVTIAESRGGDGDKEKKAWIQDDRIEAKALLEKLEDLERFTGELR